MAELTQEPILNVDFDDLKHKCEYEARVMLNNSIGVFLDDKLREEEYVKNKLEVDIMSLAGMIYQLRVNEGMQKALMKQVDAGMINPKMFEVFSQMSRAIGELNKQMLATVEAIKSTYKDLRMDFKEKQHELTAYTGGPVGEIGSGEGVVNPNIMTTADGSFVTMGTKEIIKNMRLQKTVNRTYNNNDIIDINSEE
jgi:aldehyde:ferredoxin oxidoreductase